MFREKLKKLFKDAYIPYNEQVDKIRPYMGNPFIAPGSLGMKAMMWRQSKTQKAQELFSDDESPSKVIDNLSTVSEESNFIVDAQEFKATKKT